MENVMNKIIFTLILIFSFNPSFAEPKIPNGYAWSGTGPGETDFLKPDGWFLKIEKNKGTYAIFITKEDIAKVSQFQTGFSVNVIKNITKKTGVSASNYALAFISKIVEKKQTIKNPWSINNGPFKGYATQVKDNVKIMHYMLIGNDTTDTLFLMIFEAPPSEWENAWSVGKNILNYMKLDDQN